MATKPAWHRNLLRSKAAARASWVATGHAVKSSHKCHLCGHAYVHHGLSRCSVAYGSPSRPVRCKCPGFQPKPPPSEWKGLLNAVKRS